VCPCLLRPYVAAVYIDSICACIDRRKRLKKQLGDDWEDQFRREAVGLYAAINKAMASCADLFFPTRGAADV
jgi:hypothetical protein